MEVELPANFQAQVMQAITAGDEMQFKNAIRAKRILQGNKLVCRDITEEMLNLAASKQEQRFLCALLVLLPSNDRQCLRRKVPCTITDRGMSVPVLTTPLHTAARQGLYRNVFRLMEAGANNSLYEVLDTARQPLYQYRQRQAASVAANPRTYTDKVNRVLSRKIRMQLLAEVEVAEQAGTDIANMVSSYIAE